MDLPARAGARPRVTRGMPHSQLDQTAPRDLQDRVCDAVLAWPRVRAGASHVSVPGTRAFHVDAAVEPARSLLPRGTEFGHVHPPYDGSLHVFLPAAWVQAVARAGWGELHPLAAQGALPPHVAMVYGPRDASELDVVLRIVRAAHEWATTGAAAPP